MKILMFSDYFLPHVGGGVEKVVYEISNRLVKNGDRVCVVTLNTRNAPKQESIDGIDVYRAKSIGLTGLTGLQGTVSPASLSLALNISRRFKPDLIHAHNLFFSTTIVATLVKKLINVPLVLTLHLGSTDLMYGKDRLLATSYESLFGRWIGSNADRVIAVSGVVQSYATKSLGIRKEKISVVPNGVNLSEFRPSDPSTEKRKGPDYVTKVAVVGRIIANKGIQFLIKAAPAVVCKRQVEFIVVGDGPMKNQMRLLTKKLGVEQNFKFIGEVSSVAEILRGCDMLVHPSITDGMSLTVLEAMACGIPVIATRVAGTPEIVIDGITGILCPPCDQSALAEAVIELAENRSFAKKLARNAEKFVEHYYDWDEIAAMNKRIYAELLTQNAGS
jgi:glycosyltransferase involved in cell wall biosynthesis